MAPTLNPGEPIGDEVRAVAASLVARLDRVLEHPERLGFEESVHEARKRAKELRALARLVRPALGDLYKPTNRAFRDAARELAEARDAHVVVETLDSLIDVVPDGVDWPDVDVERTELLAWKQGIYRSLEEHRESFATARLLSAEGAGLIENWELADDFEVLAGGLARTYGRFVGAFRRCQGDSTVAAFHEWRKRAKYHRYHLEFLRGIYPVMLDPWIDGLHGLTDALGEDHDLAVLTARVGEQAELLGGADQAAAVTVLAEQRSSLLREHALSLGARLAAEDPAAVVDRLRVWWNASRTAGAEPRHTAPAGLAR